MCFLVQSCSFDCIFGWQQLTDSLLEMEEERAIWSAKEKASIEAIEEKSKVYNMEITSLSREMSEVRFISDCVHREEFACHSSNCCLPKISIQKEIEGMHTLLSLSEFGDYGLTLLYHLWFDYLLLKLLRLNLWLWYHKRYLFIHIA